MGHFCPSSPFDLPKCQTIIIVRVCVKASPAGGFWTPLDLNPPSLPRKKIDFDTDSSRPSRMSRTTPGKNKKVSVSVKASPAEGWRRLHKNTAYAHLWAEDQVFRAYGSGVFRVSGFRFLGVQVFRVSGFGVLGVWLWGFILGSTGQTTRNVIWGSILTASRKETSQNKLKIDAWTKKGQNAIWCSEKSTTYPELTARGGRGQVGCARCRSGWPMVV